MHHSSLSFPARALGVCLLLAALAASLAAAKTTAVLADLWPARAPILVLGENHDSVAHTRFVRANLDGLRAAGMTRLAIEIPADEQRDIAAFLAEPARTPDWLSRAIWHVTLRELPAAYVETLAMIEWARTYGIAVVAIDATGPVQVRIGAAQAELARRGIEVPHSAAGRRAWERVARPQTFRFLADRDLVVEFWRLLFHERTRAMAAHLERCTDGRTVAVVGATHAALAGWEGRLAASGIDPRDIPPGGIADFAAVAVHTIVIVGASDLTQELHPVETYVLRHHGGTRALAFASVAGLGCVDAAAFLPFLGPVPAGFAWADRPMQQSGGLTM